MGLAVEAVTIRSSVSRTLPCPDMFTGQVYLLSSAANKGCCSALIVFVAHAVMDRDHCRMMAACTTSG
jgi:hypothetical protein